MGSELSPPVRHEGGRGRTDKHARLLCSSSRRPDVRSVRLALRWHTVVKSNPHGWNGY